MKFKLLVLALIVFFFTVNIADAEMGMVVYELSSQNSTPTYQLWNTTSWSAAANTSNVTGAVRWVVLKNNPIKYEKILGTLDSNNITKVQFYNGTGWSASTTMATSSTSLYRTFDIAVEQQSGNVIVVYNNGTAGQLAYRIWNGTSWGNEQNVSTGGTADVTWVRMESKPSSNETILVILDENSAINARIWNGTNWGTIQQLEITTEVSTKEDFDVAYEQSSGDALVVWADASTANPRYRTYSNGTWSDELAATVSASQTANYQWMRLKSYPDNDRIMLCTVDAGSDLNCVQWSGSGWGTTKEIDTSIEYVSGTSFRNFDIAPETASVGFALIYGNSGLDYFTFCRCNSNSNCYAGTWETCQTFLSSVDIGTDTSWGYLEFDPISSGKLTAVMTDQTGQQWRARIGCTASANSCVADENSVSLGTSTDNDYESAMFSYAPIIPNQTSITALPDPAKGGDTLTITANGVNDTNNNTLYFYCDSSTIPTSSNTDCTGGSTVDTLPPYNLTCTFTTSQTDQSNTIYCRVHDGYYYSQTKSASYTTDSTSPTTSINNVAGDIIPTYYDNVNDGWTNITVDGETSMSCRWSTSDLSYSSMSNDCSVIGVQTLCSPATTTQGLDAYNFYTACRDSVGNEQNSTNNLDVTTLVTDWTTPTTSDNSSTDIQTPNYTVEMTESDNLFSSATITTNYCTDTVGSCTPNTAIDNGGVVTFTSSNRGVNFLRYNSSDPAGNVQTIQNKTININRLPILTSATDNVTTIRGGSGVLITTVSSDADTGQNLTLYVCNSASITSTGCGDTTYCSNATSAANATCSFTSEADSTTHNWHAFIYDSLNESAATNASGTYTTDSTAPTITIVNPQNQTYSENSVSVQLSLSETGSWSGYSLDNAANVTMGNSTPTFWSVTLSGLSNGAHTLRFYANDSYGNMGTNSRVFSVDTTLTDTAGPSITVWSPTNGTYYISSNVLANITLSENGSNATYSLNGTANVSMGNVSLTSWNVTLTLQNGLHNITFYANDTSTNRNTGNSSVAFFYVDTSAPQNTTQGPTTSNDTIDVTCYSQWTDNIDLNYGFLEHNETGTVINSTQISLSSTSDWINYTISSTNTTPSIIQCKAYAYDKAGNVNTSTWFINITDITSPAVENISYAPNTTDALDPNIMVNVTVNVSDNVVLSRVLLQFKLANETAWNETQMTALGGTGYRGNFTPAIGNYSFRIFANDTSNNTNTSSITNVSVEQDRTWVNVTTISATKSIVQTQSRVIGLGNLTINNTGDFDLNFTMTSDRNWITFNGTNTSLIFIVNSSLNYTTFNVTANTTGFAVGSYTYNITINSYTLNPTLVSSQTINGTVVVQNVAGPYFIVSITTYDATVTQGDGGVDLSVSLENAGTGDATGTWLAWSLPSGWTNTSGVLNKSVGFLGVGSTVTNSIVVSVSSSASTGSQTITASAGSSETTGSDSKTVTVSSAPGTPSTPSTASGGGGSAAPSITPEEQALLLQTNETLELVRGLNDTFIIRVTNPFRYSNLTNVSLDVKGFLAQYIGLSPNAITNIEYNKTGFFEVTITAPSYLTKGSHILNFTIKGRMTGAFTRNIIEKRLVTLLVHEVSREESNTTLQQAEQSITGMKDAGFSIATLQKLLGQATKSFNERDYEKVKELSERITSIKNTAFSTYALVQEVKEKVKQAEDKGLRADATKNLLNMALAAFEREDYPTAERRVKDAQLVYAIETGGKINIVKFLMDNWWEVLIFLGIFSVAGVIVYRRTIIVVIKRRLKDLVVEEANILELMKDIQKKTFVEKIISSAEYHKALYEYEKRLNEIKELRTKLRSKRVGIVKVSRELDSLKKENDDIISQMKDAQKDYFEKRIIGRPTYERRMESFRLRRTEIEEALTVLETKLAKEKRLKELKGSIAIVQFVEKIKTSFKGIKKPKKPKEVRKIEKLSFDRLSRKVKDFFKKRQVKKKVEFEPEKTEKTIAEEIEEAPVKKIQEPSPLSESLKKVKGRIQNKLSEWGEAIERKQDDVQREQMLRKIYSVKSQYDFSRKFGQKNMRKEISLKIKRLIGKIKFKLS